MRTNITIKGKDTLVVIIYNIYINIVHPKFINILFSELLGSTIITRKNNNINVTKCLAYMLVSKTYDNLHVRVSFVKLQNTNRYNANSGITRSDTLFKDSKAIQLSIIIYIYIFHVNNIKNIINSIYMGNTSAKQHVYQQYYENMEQNQQQNQQQIDLTSLDPYKVLNVQKNFTWNQLKDAYKQAAIKTHPDKPGGNKVVFDFVTSCFKTLAEEYKLKHSNKSHIDMKQESTQFFEKMVNTNSPHPSQHMSSPVDEPFEKRFNKVFDDCRYQEEEIEYGYGSIMTQSTGKREDISIENVFNKDKVDNSTFNELFDKKVPVSKDIIKYKEPEALPMAKNLQFTEIGSKRPDDYSSDTTKNQLAYTDYMRAYNGTRLANPDDIKSRKDFKTVQEYEKYRDKKIKQTLNEKERRYIDEQKRLEEQHEFERLERIKLQNIAIQKAHEKANRLMLK
jgi:curved DNA-binding protein CbpA